MLVAHEMTSEQTDDEGLAASLSYHDTGMTYSTQSPVLSLMTYWP